MMFHSLNTQQSNKKSKLIGDSEEQLDWLSCLPDDVICHILSFMPTKFAVRTSLLSTRWKSIWNSVPNFEFYSSCSWSSSNHNDDSYGFMNFVDRVLLLHNSSTVKKFQLKCDGYHDPYRLKSWIFTAIKLNVQELVLRFYIGVIVELPRSLFNSVNLVILKLEGTVVYRFPMLVFLPSLKTLHLRSLSFLDDNIFKNLISGCPILEELDMYSSVVDDGNIKTLCICSPTLKKLNIYNRARIYGIVIKTPSLEILGLNDHVSMIFNMNELPSIVKANFCVNFSGYDYQESDEYCNRVAGMLGKFMNVQHLRISFLALKVVAQASTYNLPIFHNLIKLDIGILDTHWSILPDLFGHMPNLKVLVFKKDRKCCHLCSWHAVPENVPNCLSLCLETIIFNGFGGCKAEMKMVRYFLENAMVLKKLTITCWTRNKQILTRVQKYPRGSSTCQIEMGHFTPSDP